MKPWAEKFFEDVCRVYGISDGEVDIETYPGFGLIRITSDDFSPFEREALVEPGKIAVAVKRVDEPLELMVVDNDAAAFHEIIGNCFDIGRPFPGSMTEQLVGICDDNALFNLPFSFDGDCQPWHGTVIFAMLDPLDSTELTSPLAGWMLKLMKHFYQEDLL